MDGFYQKLYVYTKEEAPVQVAKQSIARMTDFISNLAESILTVKTFANHFRAHQDQYSEIGTQEEQNMDTNRPLIGQSPHVPVRLRPTINDFTNQGHTQSLVTHAELINQGEHQAVSEGSQKNLYYVFQKYFKLNNCEKPYETTEVGEISDVNWEEIDAIVDNALEDSLKDELNRACEKANQKYAESKENTKCTQKRRRCSCLWSRKSDNTMKLSPDDLGNLELKAAKIMFLNDLKNAYCTYKSVIASENRFLFINPESEGTRAAENIISVQPTHYYYEIDGSFSGSRYDIGPSRGNEILKNRIPLNDEANQVGKMYSIRFKPNYLLDEPAAFQPLGKVVLNAELKMRHLPAILSYTSQTEPSPSKKQILAGEIDSGSQIFGTLSSEGEFYDKYFAGDRIDIEVTPIRKFFMSSR